MSDPVDHPSHYNAHPSGVECITVVEHMGFNLGNAIKYIWRADEKADALEDLRKAAWYVQREIERRTNVSNIPQRFIMGPAFVDAACATCGHDAFVHHHGSGCDAAGCPCPLAWRT